MTIFADNSIEESKRRDNAFRILCAMREALTIAKRTPQAVPYKKAIQLIYDIDPELYKDITDLLKKTNESETVRYYKQKAELMSGEQKKKVTPEEIIIKDLEEEQKLLGAGESTDLIERKIFELEAALEYFQPEDISENFLLNHDFNLNSRHEYFGKEIYKSAKVKDYELHGNRVLRLRLLHPDKAERITGTDLVYEQFNLKSGTVRFMHLQYKTWDSADSKLYFSNGNLLEQVQKLEDNICNAGYCNSHQGNKYATDYRFPYCAAFLRPTSHITKPDSNLISTGIHIPVCKVREIQAKDKFINNKNSRNKSVGHRIFEELFIDGFIGSRFIFISELEKFYKEKGINAELGRIRVHAQEVIYETESEKNSKT